MFYSGLLIGLSILAMWFGAETVVTNVDRLSKRFRIAEFWVSFFVLGLAMSGPELAVGINSIIMDLPEVLVGDKIGSSIGIFLLIMPILAILADGLELKNKVRQTKLLLSFFLILLPSMLLVDGNLTKADNLICLVVYILLTIYFGLTAKQENVIKSWGDMMAVKKSSLLKEIVMIFFGSIVIYLSGNVLMVNFKKIVDGLNGSFFAISLLLMSLGTSMPELVVVVKSVLRGQREVAFGGYLGSAVANSMILAILGLIYGDVIIGRDIYFIWLYVLFLIGISLFYWFIRSKNILSRREGMVLVGFYLGLVVITTALL